MIKKLSILCLIPFLAFPQSKIEEIQEPRKFFIPIDSQKITDPKTNIVITSVDTLIVVKKNSIDLSGFDLTSKDSKEFLLRYMLSIFYCCNENSTQTYSLLQWNTPINVYFDKSIPKEIKKNLKHFINQLNNIPNLTISVSKKVKNANYLITKSGKTFSFSRELYKFESKEEEQNFAFNNGDYIPLVDRNNKIYGCILELNPENILDNTVFESNLKQLFFLSLGRFFLNVKKNEEHSFFNFKYNLNNDVSPEDLELLKFHYQNIYPQKIDLNVFREILKYANN